MKIKEKIKNEKSKEKIKKLIGKIYQPPIYKITVKKDIKIILALFTNKKKSKILQQNISTL